MLNIKMLKTSNIKLKSLKPSFKVSRSNRSNFNSQILLKPYLSSPEKPKKSSIKSNCQKQGSMEKLPSLQSYRGDMTKTQNRPGHKAKRNMSLEGIATSVSPEKAIKRNHSVDNEGPLMKGLKEWNSKDLPYTPEQVLTYFSFSLTSYEKLEIKSFESIFYLGLGIIKLAPEPKLPNNGYDDERNDLILVKSDHIAYRYEIIQIIGRGSYGQVIKSYDHKDKKFVAIKIIRNLNCITTQAQIEVSILKQLRSEKHPNLIHLIDNLIFRNHIIEIFDLLDVNLYQIIRMKKSGLSLNQVRKIGKQILSGMQCYEALGIIHCDLKPENIMISFDTNILKIIDFGSGCFCNKKLYTYIQSRFYRAPEVILELGYNFMIDVWSFACVLAELATGVGLFRGKNERSLFLSIVEVLGLPPSVMLERSDKCDVIIKEIQEKAVKVEPGSRALEVILPQDPDFIDFIKACLCWNPYERLTVDKALGHRFFRNDEKSSTAYKDLKLVIPGKEM